ncbi:MAG TPA: porin family protein [Brevundimonas sp.]|jgi:hypothetical protein|uniref:porin family protein n=1 Tax=Brevundimonas sp. TaxID=1871086 RepID=UPI002DE4EACE|nr:porin family protein [Brevundimonas sp.]
MRNVFLYTVAATALFAAPAAMAQVAQPVYGSVAYSHLDADDGDLGAIYGRVGYQFSPNFAIEGEGSFGVKDETFDLGGGVEGRVEHKYDAAAYAVGILPVSPNFEVFARGGYGTTRLKASAAGLSSTENAESWNYGVGANYYFDGQNGIRADWTRRDFRDDAGEADVWSLGYVRKF